MRRGRNGISTSAPSPPWVRIASSAARASEGSALRSAFSSRTRSDQGTDARRSPPAARRSTNQRGPFERSSFPQLREAVLMARITLRLTQDIALLTLKVQGKSLSCGRVKRAAQQSWRELRPRSPLNACKSKTTSLWRPGRVMGAQSEPTAPPIVRDNRSRWAYDLLSARRAGKTPPPHDWSVRRHLVLVEPRNDRSG